nr:hypothetical protein [Actinoplanes ovalisporus]
MALTANRSSKVLFVHFFDRRRAEDPCVQEEEIEVAESIPDLVHNAVGVGQGPGVSLQDSDVGGKLAASRGEGVRVLAGHQHSVSPIMQQFCCGTADPAGSSGDQGEGLGHGDLHSRKW